MATLQQPYVSIAIANLATMNPQFDHFVAEMHKDNTGTTLLEQLNIKGVWIAANKDYEQQNVDFFRSAQLGTTYFFRIAVVDKQGNLSPYTAWVSFVAGSSTAPNPTYTPTVTATSGGIAIAAGPSTTTGIDHFEAYWNLTDVAPASDTVSNLPHSSDGTWSINVGSGQTAYIWVRAVDASGNRQTWVQLGGTGVGFQSQDGSVFKVPPGTLDGVPDGTGSAPRRALPVAPIAQRPAAGSSGRLFHATDQGNNGLTYRDTGSAWVQIGQGTLDDTLDGNGAGGGTYSKVKGSEVVTGFVKQVNDGTNVRNAADIGTVIKVGGDIQSSAIISGRTEGVGTTVQKLNSSGLLVDADQVAADGPTYLRPTVRPDSESVENANFDLGSGSTVPGWVPVNATISIDNTKSPPFGVNALKVVAGVQFGSAGSIAIYPVVPGEIYKISGYTLSDGTAHPDIVFQIQTEAGAFIVNGQFSPGAVTSWTPGSATVTVPSNGVIGRIFLDNGATGGSGTCWFKGIRLQKVRGLDDEVVDGTSRFARTSVHSSFRPTTNPLTAHDAGTNVTINIAAFTMQVGATAVSDSSGSITGLSYSTRYFIYYDDPTLAGGAVSYQATTTKENSLQNAGRFFVGSIITPKATAPDTAGAGDGGVGGQFGSTLTLLGSATTTGGASGGSVSNPQNAIDGDPTTDAVITGGTLATESLAVSGFSPAQYPGGVVTLNVRSSASFSGTGAGSNATVQYSLDGGSTFTNIYSVAANRSLQTDSVTLPSAQNLALVKVNAGASSGGGGGTVTLDLYEVWISVSQ